MAYIPQWRDQLVVSLRMKDVPGDKIGGILAEIDSHMRETGESFEEAFGDPRAYADRRATEGTLPTTSPLARNLRLVGLGLSSFVGGVLAASAAWSIGSGNLWWDWVPTLVFLIIGTVILLVPFWRMSPDLITDPRSGQPYDGTGPDARLMATVGYGVMLVVVGLLGWWLG